MSVLALSLHVLGSTSLWAVTLIGAAAFAVVLVLGWWLLSLFSISPKNPLDATFLAGITHERRSAPRRKGNLVEVELSKGPGAPNLFGSVVDRSHGGLCLLLDRSVAEGSTLRIRPAGSQDDKAWSSITVRFCHAEGKDYAVGCQFQTPPTWSQRVLFG